MLKKISIILAFFMLTGVSYSCSVLQPDHITFSKNKRGKRKKNGRYKKRKKLFGKKNDCDCPKH
ncbi:hypothetical protein [Jiulongibacter sediminis]|uniref:hypothetical protein n=1 Tax=Jiulongibacter sediminis TaxID=1605367 RepID=UPI0012FE4974|nr:hypothetical protein [Jiulongibacter sediminis]